MGWLDNAKAATIKFEGSVSHMYLDTVGKVTVGVGFMIPNKTEAAKYPFVKRAGSGKATKAEIETDYTTVSSKSKGKVASWYKQFTQLDLPKSAIDKKLGDVLKQMEKGCQGIYSNFNSLPDPVKEALIDIAYNTGVGGLKKFVKMKAAIDKKDYTTAASESKRPQVSAARNKYVYDLFMKAARAAGAGAGAAAAPAAATKPPTRAELTAASKKVLKKGAKGKEVLVLQRQLNHKAKANLTVDGDFGSKTDKAVRAFQKSKKLTVDGVVGPNTWAALIK